MRSVLEETAKKYDMLYQIYKYWSIYYGQYIDSGAPFVLIGGLIKERVKPTRYRVEGVRGILGKIARKCDTYLIKKTGRVPDQVHVV